MKTSHKLSFVIFATMMSTACQKPAMSFIPSDSIDGLASEGDESVEGDPRR